jgi:hypothetical protein
MNTRLLAIFAIVAVIGLAAAAATSIVIPSIPQAQALVARIHPSCSDNPGYDHGERSHPCGPPL